MSVAADKPCVTCNWSKPRYLYDEVGRNCTHPTVCAVDPVYGRIVPVDCAKERASLPGLLRCGFKAALWEKAELPEPKPVVVVPPPPPEKGSWMNNLNRSLIEIFGKKRI